MTFEEFQKSIEKQKEKANKYCWYFLIETLYGEINPDETRINVAKYLMDRFEGKAIQKQEIEAKGLPVVLEVKKQNE